MDPGAWRQRGAELAPRAVKRSRASMRTRLTRLRERAAFILQCGVAAALAWWVARSLLDHPLPFFAPVTAIICLGMSYGQRLRRAYELMVGVAVGVFIGDLFVHYFGTGVWQLALVSVVAMSLAALLGAGLLLTTQAGVQSVIVTTLVAAPGQAFSRWLDAVTGGVLALAITVLAPAAPVRRPRLQAAQVVAEISGILRDTAASLVERDPAMASAALKRARGSEAKLNRLRSAAAEGMAVVRLSPLRRRHLPGVQAIDDLLEPLDRAIRNLRVLVRRAAIATWREEFVPTSYVGLLTTLADATDEISAELGQRRLPTTARRGLVAIADLTAVIDPNASLSSEVMRAQARSMVVDLIMLTGLSYEEARQMVPDTHSAAEVAGEG